jgi:LuxR family maltose regulon positive regulatory protein
MINSAPAGSGKMPLLRVWAGHSEHRLAMLQVQRDQQDTRQFWLAQLDADRQVLPFAVTGSGELLEELPQHTTAYAALLHRHPRRPARIVAATGPAADPAAQPERAQGAEYLPANLSRPEIAGDYPSR